MDSPPAQPRSERLIAPAYRDYTQGSIGRNIWLLGLPMTLEQIIMGTYQLLDGIWVGRLGSAELAAIVMSTTINFVLTSVAMGLGVGATATVARRIGEHNLDAASHAAWQVLFFSAMLAVIVGGTGFILARPLLVLLGSEPQVAALGTAYLRIIFTGLFASMLTQSCNAVLRGSGEADYALRAIVIGYGLAIVLDPLLILGWGPIPGLRLQGGALAAVIGPLCSLIYALWLLTSGRARVRLAWRTFRLDFPLILRIAKIGVPSSLQMFFRSASRLTILSIIAVFGTNALAGYSATTRVMMFALIPCFGLGNAAATLVGQNLGAGKPERSSRSAWTIASYSMLYMGAMTALFIALPRLILSLFTADPQVLAIGIPCLWITGSTQIASGLGVVMSRALEGAGDTAPSMFVNLGTLWGMQIPLAYILSQYTSLGVNGIWVGFALANLANGILLPLWFQRGSWRRRKV